MCMSGSARTLVVSLSHTHLGDTLPCRPRLSAPAFVQACPENTVTSDMFVAPATPGRPPYTSPDSCLSPPGWGWYNGVATICAVGYYKPGYNNMDWWVRHSHTC